MRFILLHRFHDGLLLGDLCGPRAFRRECPFLFLGSFGGSRRCPGVGHAMYRSYRARRIISRYRDKVCNPVCVVVLILLRADVRLFLSMSQAATTWQILFAETLPCCPSLQCPQPTTPRVMRSAEPHCPLGPVRWSGTKEGGQRNSVWIEATAAIPNGKGDVS